MALSGDSKRKSVYLNVYDLTTLNNYLYWFGLGIFHSAIEVHGVEFAFGAHDYSTSGVFEVEPRQCPGFIFRRTVELGTTDLSPEKLREVIDAISSEYKGNSYHLISKNCNHFSNDFSLRLIGKGIPGWVNRLAAIGAFCNCLLPGNLQVNAVRHTPEYSLFEGQRNLVRQGSIHMYDDEGEQLLSAADVLGHRRTHEWLSDDNQGHRLVMTVNGERMWN